MTKTTTASKASTRAKTATSTSTRKASETPTILLKTIYDDHMKANPNSTLTTKKMRAVLRTSDLRNVHVRNATWIFTDGQYDAVRGLFDPEYAKKAELKAKRVAARKPKASKADTAVDVHDEANAA